MRVIVAGSRTIKDYTVVKDAIEKSGFDVSILITGGAIGVDTLAETWAGTHGIKVLKYEPDWGKYGRAAGPIRNSTMIKNADALVAVWDGISRGTRDIIEKAMRAGLRVYGHKIVAKETP